MDTKLRALIEEATTHCYDDEEAFWGMFCTLQMRLAFPLSAKLKGGDVKVVGLDEPASGLEQGVVADLDGGGQAPLADLELVNPDPTSTEWVAAYRLWLEK